MELVQGFPRDIAPFLTSIEYRIDVLFEYASESWPDVSSYLFRDIDELYKNFEACEFDKNEVDRIFKEFASNKGNLFVFHNRLNIIRKTLKLIRSQLEISSKEEIIREIKFPPEYQQAGISILTYFAVVLQQKYPSINVSVTIRQEKNKVIMIILTPDGEKEEISRTLESYGMIVAGTKNIGDLLSDPYHVMSLKHKLQMAELEVRHTKELMYTDRENTKFRINDLEGEVKRLFSVVERNLSNQDSLTKSIISLVDMSKAKDEKYAEFLLKSLGKSLDRNDEDNGNEILKEIKNEEPSIFESLYDDVVVKGGISGVSGNFLYQWILPLTHMLPK